MIKIITKVLNAQLSKAHAVILINNKPGENISDISISFVISSILFKGLSLLGDQL